MVCEDTCVRAAYRHSCHQRFWLFGHRRITLYYHNDIPVAHPLNSIPYHNANPNRQTWSESPPSTHTNTDPNQSSRHNLVPRIHIRFVFQQHLCYLKILAVDGAEKRGQTILHLMNMGLRVSVESTVAHLNSSP